MIDLVADSNTRIWQKWWQVTCGIVTRRLFSSWVLYLPPFQPPSWITHSQGNQPPFSELLYGEAQEVKSWGDYSPAASKEMKPANNQASELWSGFSGPNTAFRWERATPTVLLWETLSKNHPDAHSQIQALRICEIINVVLTCHLEENEYRHKEHRVWGHNVLLYLSELYLPILKTRSYLTIF